MVTAVCSLLSQIGVAFYEMLQAVDQHSKHLAYMDPICDFLYHIKYMFTGDSVKDQVTHTHTHTLWIHRCTHVLNIEGGAGLKSNG